MSAAPSAEPIRLPILARVLYGAGSMASGAMLQIGGLLLLYYNQVIGLSAQLASLALAVALVIDAFWDPLVGQISDNLRTPWGRRHPIMYFSAVPLGAAYVLLFSPPHGLNQTQLFAWLLCTVVAVRLCGSLYEVPSGALAPELAPDYNDRTVLIGYRWLLGTLGGAIAAVLAYGVFLKRAPGYPLGQLNPAGYPPLAISAAILIAGSILVSSLGTHRYIPRLHRPAARSPALSVIAREVVASLNNWNLGVAVVAGVVAAISTSLHAGLTIYVSTYFWRLPAQSVLVLVLTGLVSTPLAVFISPLLSRHMGKRAGCMTLFFLSVLAYNYPLVLRLMGLFPGPGSPVLLPILTINGVFAGVMSTGGYILVTSMIADIVEEVQVKTGRRAEGLLFAADALLNKVISGFGAVLPGLLLAAVGFPAAARLSTLDPQIMRRLVMIYVPVTAGLSSLSIWCWRFYRIDRASHEANLATLRAAPGRPPTDAPPPIFPNPPVPATIDPHRDL